MKNNFNRYWEADFFDVLYWNLFMRRPPSQIKKEGKIILSLSPSSALTYLDLCCGVGDIGNYLAQQQKIVTGVEISKDYQLISQQKFNKINFINKSVLDFNTKQKFDVVYNWFSSFGYFDEDDNLKLLLKAYHFLNENGIFILETYNSYDVIKNFKNIFTYQKDFYHQKYLINRSCQINFSERKLEQEWLFFKNQKLIKQQQTFTKLYFIDDFINLFKQVGFKNIEVYGTTKKYQSFKLDDGWAPRIIVRGQK